MADFIKTQNSFANGAVAPEFYAHDNINGLSILENMDVLAGGGLSRRRGLRDVILLRGPARIIPFSVAVRFLQYTTIRELSKAPVAFSGGKRYNEKNTPSFPEG